MHDMCACMCAYVFVCVLVRECEPVHAMAHMGRSEDHLHAGTFHFV